MDKVRIGTRGSRLALAQAKQVQDAILQADSRIETELVILHTKGDKILDRPLAEIGDKGLFVSEFEQALLEDRIDLAVHSAKDLPLHPACGLRIAAVLPRADVRDVLVVKKGGELPEKSDKNVKPGQPFLLGTGSRRRQVQAQKLWNSVECSLIRGNVETRLRKLEEGHYDGILLAKAGLDRLGINGQTDQRFDFYPLCPEEFLPAACQGIIAVEAGEASPWENLLCRISDARTYRDFVVEQEVLVQLQADCSEAAAAWCREKDGALLLDVMYGSERAFLSCGMEKKQWRQLARRAADMVKKSGDSR